MVWSNVARKKVAGFAQLAIPVVVGLMANQVASQTIWARSMRPVVTMSIIRVARSGTSAAMRNMLVASLAKTLQIRWYKFFLDTI
jgi:hypothetical protein